MGAPEPCKGSASSLLSSSLLWLLSLLLLMLLMLLLLLFWSLLLSLWLRLLIDSAPSTWSVCVAMEIDPVTGTALSLTHIDVEKVVREGSRGCADLASKEPCEDGASLLLWLLLWLLLLIDSAPSTWSVCVAMEIDACAFVAGTELSVIHIGE